ncbi:FecR domain-containing protein [Candidatus Woesebacteria bacterium]|nr:FecR domain-containing protein [Candidatus Woesebacteria bacterium]
MRKKKIIAGFFVLATLIFVGVIFVIAINSQNQPTSPQTQSIETSVDEATPLPVLKIFSFDGVEVAVGTKIKTEKGGRAAIVYPNKSVTRIDENSLVTVEKLEENGSFSASILIEAGRVWSRVARLFGAESYETKTSTTVAAVRGTSFGHAIEKGQDRIIATRRKVLGKCLNQTQESEINEGNKGVFTCIKGRKALVQSLTAKEVLDKWIKFNVDQDALLDRESATTFDDVPSPTPSPTPKPTLKPTPTPTPTVQGTSTTSSTTTPTPTPIPLPPAPIISGIDPGACDAKTCNVFVTGDYFTANNSLYAYEPRTGSSTPASSSNIQPPNYISATFTDLSSGVSYQIKVVDQYGQYAISTDSFTVP